LNVSSLDFISTILPFPKSSAYCTVLNSSMKVQGSYLFHALIVICVGIISFNFKSFCLLIQSQNWNWTTINKLQFLMILCSQKFYNEDIILKLRKYLSIYSPALRSDLFQVRICRLQLLLETTLHDLYLFLFELYN